MSRSILFLSAFCLVTEAAAQTSPATSAPAHSDETLSLQNFVVTASPLQRSQADLAQSTTVLGGTALSRQQQATLGETLAGLPGVSSSYFGPGASRPIIRGLGGDRIRILENGTGTLDASVASPDHAVSVEPFLVEQVEVVRGPASLLYGSSAVGGVVNVVTHRIEHEVPQRTVTGLLDGRYGGNNDERAYGGVVDVAMPAGAPRAVVLHLDGFKRESGNVRVPGFAKVAAVREEEAAAALAAGEPAPEFAHGFIPNTGVESDGWAAGLSFVADKSHAGFSYSGFNTFYGVPNEEGVKIDLRQRRLDVQGETAGAFGSFSSARFKFGQADYRHIELEDGAPGTTFTNRGFDGRIELRHENLGGFAGIWGVQAGRSDFAALGEEAFLPESQTRTAAVFAFEETKIGTLTPQVGARYERQMIEVGDGSGRQREDGAVSFSAGAVWNPAPGWVVGLSATRTDRAPNVQELYSEGPHIGTNAWEIGDAALRRERSTGLELVLRKPAGFVTGEMSVYAHRFDGYVFEDATGRVVVERDAGFEFIDPAEVEAGEESLTEYRYAQSDVKFHGAEAEVIFHLHEAGTRQLHLRLTGDLVRARTNAGANLPRIPPARIGGGLFWTDGTWSAGADWQHVFAQERTAPNERATRGYAMLGVTLAWHRDREGGAWDVFVRGSNLADAEARTHTSFLKDVSPLPGRNIALGARWTF